MPEPDVPPSNPVAATWWGVKWLSTLTPDRLLMLLFVAALVMMYYDQRVDKLTFRQEVNERLDGRDRDQISERENHRKHELALVGLLQTNANAQDKVRREEQRIWQDKSELHMKTAEATLREMAVAQKEFAASQNKLADAVNAFTKKVNGPN